MPEAKKHVYEAGSERPIIQGNIEECRKRVGDSASVHPPSGNSGCPCLDSHSAPPVPLKFLYRLDTLRPGLDPILIGEQIRSDQLAIRVCKRAHARWRANIHVMQQGRQLRD